MHFKCSFRNQFIVPYGICRMYSIPRMRISELERELEEITKKAIMTSTHASKTASALAKVSWFHSFLLFQVSDLLHLEGRHGRGRLRSRAVLQEEQEGHDREQPEDGKGLKGHQRDEGWRTSLTPNQASPVTVPSIVKQPSKMQVIEPRHIERWNGLRLPEQKFLFSRAQTRTVRFSQTLSWMHNIRFVTLSMMQINEKDLFM